MTSPSDHPQLLEYEDGAARRRRSKTVIEQVADHVARGAILIVVCAFVVGWISFPDSGLAIFAVLAGALAYVTARIVRDDVGRAASVQMFISGIPALVSGIMILVPLFVSIKRFGWRFAPRAAHDFEPVYAGIFVISVTWFIIARVYGAGTDQAPMQLRSDDSVNR
jgi:hypothetical protein